MNKMYDGDNAEDFPMIETTHGIYKVGDYVFAFPNWELYPMSKMMIICTEDNLISIGGGMFSVDLVRHTQLEAVMAMQQLRNNEIKRILDLKYIHPKMKMEL